VAAPRGDIDAVRESLGPEVIVVAGGATRQESVFAALSATPPEFQVILVHDAARALAPSDLIERVAQAVRDGHPVVIPVLPVVDTIKVVDESGFVTKTVDRSRLRAVQTPQGFDRAALSAAHAAALEVATDDAGLAEAIGLKVFCVPGAAEAAKITTAADLLLADLLLRHGS
jgi:2-C-methyl-D-erythritol 4-phosphate cytidylyltransferase